MADASSACVLTLTALTELCLIKTTGMLQPAGVAQRELLEIRYIDAGLERQIGEYQGLVNKPRNGHYIPNSLAKGHLRTSRIARYW